MGLGILALSRIINFKEGLTVRGLTTAASIWITAAIGILLGIGFYLPALIGTITVLLVLSAFRAVEMWLPSEFYAHHSLKFAREAVMPEDQLREMIGRHGFSIASLSHRLADDGVIFEYRMVIRSRDRRNAEKLSQHLRNLPTVKEFRIAPIGD